VPIIDGLGRGELPGRLGRGQAFLTVSASPKKKSALNATPHDTAIDLDAAARNLPPLRTGKKQWNPVRSQRAAPEGRGCAQQRRGREVKLVIGHEEDTGKPAEGLAERVGHNDLTRDGYF
jgi:hypothetical protein